MPPDIRHVESRDGTRIAYYAIGAGRPLVMLQPFQINGLRLNWAIPLRRKVTRALAEHFMVIHLDFRGTGDSEREVEQLSLERLGEDVTCVLDDLDADRASICATGTSIMVAAHLAGATPERVERLVLLGVGGSPTREQLFDLHAMNPAVGSDATASAISGLDDPEDAAALAEVIRQATAPEMFARYVQLLRATSLEELLTATSVPALLVHASEDVLFPLAAARQLSERMHDAHLLAVPSRSPLGLWRDEFAVEQIAAFVAGRWSGAEADLPPRPSPRPRSRSVTTLTNREREVLALVAKGRTNQQISEDLVISLNTVSHHLKSILTKTGAQNRTEAAALAHRFGLTDPGSAEDHQFW